MTKEIPQGFYRLSLEARRAILIERLGERHPDLTATFTEVLDGGGLSPALADHVVENVLGVYSLPLGVALNIRLNGRDRVAPMVVEEPSVIAAASNASKMMRAGGGVSATVEEPLMIAQIELRRTPAVEKAKAELLTEKERWLTLANETLAGLVQRGGGARDLEVREIGPGHLVVHLLVDCKDAMGANLVNSAAEALGPALAASVQAELGLCILSNLADRRLVRCRTRVPASALLGKIANFSEEEVLDRLEAASVFAERDPYRAATHNKGVMNGVDSVVIATGNDYRAVEAGAHAFAARSGIYRPLATWKRDGAELVGELLMPLALGVVGGTLRVHPGARLALALGEIESASDLAMLAATVGLASNLAALRALATEGIQRGHMSLHARSVAVAAGAVGDEVDRLAALLAAEKTVTKLAAEQLLLRLRGSR